MRRILPVLVLGCVAATVAVGLWLDGRGHVLGTPRPPFAFDWDPEIALGWALLAAAVLTGAVALAPRLRRLGSAAFALATFGLALAVRLAVGAARWGPEGWDEPWNESFNAKNEYLPTLPSVDAVGVRFFLDRFDALVPALPVHAAGHPPGLVLVLHWLGLDTPAAASALIIAGGTLAVPATYLIGRRLVGEDRARAAGLLSALASGTTLLGVTSADALYAALGALAAALLLASPRVAAVAGSAVLAVASAFSYAVLAVGAWSALVRLLREGPRLALAVSAACGAALAAFWVAVWAVTGFELPDVVLATEETYRASVARLRPYAFWLFGSPAAFLAFLGLPITWYAARALATGHAAAVALAVVIAVSALGGFTKAETERIWLMYVPLACVAAAAALPERRLVLALTLLAAQSLAVELLFGIVW